MVSTTRTMPTTPSMRMPSANIWEGVPMASFAITRIAWPRIAFTGHFKINDFGPYDYHRDFNQTYPMQLMADISYSLSNPEWFGLPETKFGVRGIYRTLDKYSPRFQPEDMEPLEEGEEWPDGLDDGEEWEIRTYVHLAI